MDKLVEGIRRANDQFGAVVLDIEGGRIFDLNSVGARIWELLEAGTEEAEMVRIIGEQFATPPLVVASDVHEFLDRLREHRLLMAL